MVRKGMKVIRAETGPEGQRVELSYGEWGKGRSKVRKWEIYVDGEYVDYAVIDCDAEENFARAVATGRGRK